MPILSTVEEVDAWLAEAGWYPGRDAGREAAQAVAIVADRYRASPRCFPVAAKRLRLQR
ncbi:SUKH-3 domain-containing protein [Streptomyces globisporus]|uniref:SUKH-3 domain-containing protein n=1 Tax=Streptomyces globisporus TaxID=1908 RepID=UPI0036FEFE76